MVLVPPFSGAEIPRVSCAPAAPPPPPLFQVVGVWIVNALFLAALMENIDLQTSRESQLVTTTVIPD
jgi:hypothetical protein